MYFNRKTLAQEGDIRQSLLIMSNYETILKLLKDKASVKQDVFTHTKDVFCHLKETTKEFVKKLSKKYHKTDPRVCLKVEEINDQEFRLAIGGDILVFHMHTNVFQYPKSHYYWQGSYFKDDPTRSYGGIINIYNFLTDSLKMSRENDLGLLIARIFVNRDNHFSVEGKGKLNSLYLAIQNQLFNKKMQKYLIENLIIFSMEFELYIPEYKQVQTISVKQALDFKNKIQIKTSKRLGFEFSGQAKQ